VVFLSQKDLSAGPNASRPKASKTGVASGLESSLKWPEDALDSKS